MRAGRMRRRITLQQPSTTPDSTGQVTGFTDVATVWAAVEPAKARELLGSATGAEKVIGEVDGVAIIRYRSDVTSAWRFLMDGVPYGIVAPFSPLSRKIELQMGFRRLDTGEPV